MKTLLILAFTLSSAFAHEIIGTQVLKGSRKVDIRVNNIKTTCLVKVEKVRNLLEEDSFGNPAYQVRMQAELKGEDKKAKLKIAYKKEFQMINIFPDGEGTRVEDFKYFSKEGDAKMQIDSDGRLKNFSFPFEDQTINCLF